MAASETTFSDAHVHLPATPGRVPPSRVEKLAGLLGELRACFGVEFSVVQAETGEVLHRSADLGELDWDMLAELCRQVARQGRPEFIEDRDPLLLLAIPLGELFATPAVCVGPFVTHCPEQRERCDAASRALGMTPTEAIGWIRRQPCWTSDSLMHMARQFLEKRAARRRVAQLEDEVENLSSHLSSTYEELSLLYRLTQNLRISSRDEDLARMAVEWLADAVPAESLAIQLLPAHDERTVTRDALTEPLLIAHGPCPLDCEQFTRLIDHFGLDRQFHQQVIVNRSQSSRPDWPFPSVRELVIVPLCEGTNLFGWLSAINHAEQGEFGTVEASLLSSVGAILGIHSGNTELYRKQAEFLANVVKALVSAIDAKDPYTCGHSDRVARVAVRLAEELGCQVQQLNTIYLSGLLHDIGKIGIDDQVLRKPGKLTEAEYEHIKTHTEIGYRILYGLRQLDHVLPVVLHHHEQWDGSGYPHGLVGEETPLLARIVAVADAFDAMRSDRPYRNGMPDAKVDLILRQGAGKQWDASVVEAFFRAREVIRDIASRERDDAPLEVERWV